MRIAYLDCFSGISGDMFLGALIDAGVDATVLHDAVSAMNIGATLTIEKVNRSGISSTKVNVREATNSASSASSAVSSPSPTPHNQTHTHTEAHTHIGHTHDHGHTETHTHEHTHTEGHTHTHQAHGRSLTTIRKLIQASTLATPIQQTAIHAFELLGASEAKIHNVPIEQIHFHEVGAVDAIADIVAASAGIHALACGLDPRQTLQWVASPINVGSGMVDCAHGRFPVPAPATADLLRGFPTYAAAPSSELVTPTGAALLRVLFEYHGMTFGQQPAMRVEKIGYGAGSRDPKNHPNVLRLSIGDSGEESTDPASYPAPELAARQTITVLETALDDLSPQILAQVAESALAQGALDVMLTPVIMKKGRPGTLITILCNPSQSSFFENLLLRETTTLGIRIRQDERTYLAREHVSVATAFGDIRIKLGKRQEEVLNANPEFEDCRNAALHHRVSTKQVQQAAMAAYLNGQSHA